MTKLEIVIEKKIKLGCADRTAALVDIALSIETSDIWSFADIYGVLDERRSCEEFAIEFMTAYNNEIGFRY